jgi:hypothetical protein
MEPDPMNSPAPPLTPAELAAFRARQRSRSRALALVLIALVLLFFAITIVKLRAEGVRYAHERQQRATSTNPVEHPQ